MKFCKDCKWYERHEGEEIQSGHYITILRSDSDRCNYAKDRELFKNPVSGESMTGGVHPCSSMRKESGSNYLTNQYMNRGSSGINFSKYDIACLPKGRHFKEK